MTDNIKLNQFAIFDMDGTLIDSNKHLDTITTRFFGKRNVPYTNEFLLETKTMSRTSYCRAVKELTSDPGSLEEIDREVGEYMMDIYRNDVHLMPNAEALLKKYQTAGIKMCVASATDNETVIFVLKRLGIFDYFQFVISCNDIGKDKDQPDIFLEAAKILGAASPDEVTVFEDSKVAIQTAKREGFYVVGYYDPLETPRKELSKICDLAVSDFSELL